MTTTVRQTQRLRDLVDVVGGGTPSKRNPAYWKGPIPWISPKDMKTWEIFDAVDHISKAAVENSACKIVSPPAVVIVVRGMILGRSLPVAVTRVPLAINQDLKALCPRHNIEPEYLAYMIAGATPNLLPKVDIAGHGTRRLATDVWANLELRVPSRTEQRRIVARIQEILGCVDEIKRLRRAAKREAQALERSSFADFLNRSSWPIIKLADVTYRTQYGTSKRASDKKDGVPILRMGNIREGHLDLSDLKFITLSDSEVAKYRLAPGDLLINRTNSLELVGKAAVFDSIVDGNWVFASYLIRFQINRSRVLPSYAAAVINSPVGRDYIERTARRAIGMVNINAREIGAMPLPLPPLSVQEDIMGRLDDRCTMARQMISEMDGCPVSALAPAVLSKAFAGEL